MKQLHPLLLASGSPRRAELLDQLGIRYEIEVTDTDESRRNGESPDRYVQRLALEKAAAGRKTRNGSIPTLGADTVVLLEQEILGKPRSLAESAEMLARLSGHQHQVLSAVAVVAIGGMHRVALNTTRVTFAEMPDSFIQWYCDSFATMDKAGAYAVQGPAAQYISRIDGSYSGVMGLPLYETCSLLRALGVVR
jgi:septum formation protein